MRIGVLSDSHGRADTTARAVAALNHAGVDLLIHLGDVGDERVIDELLGRPARLVFGNCDFDHEVLGRYAEHLGIVNDHPAGLLSTESRTIAFTHGHLEREMKRLLGENPDFLLHGHTHQPRDDHVNGTRIVNPGALFRAARYTVVVLDVQRDSVEFLELDKTPG